MTLLKLKSVIYRYTGLFLANAEELEYIDSKEYWKSFLKILKKKNNDLAPRDIHELLIGLWQCKHGFARPIGPILLHMKKYQYPKLRWLLGSIENVCVFFTVLKWDYLSAYRHARHNLKKRLKKLRKKSKR